MSQSVIRQIDQATPVETVATIDTQLHAMIQQQDVTKLPRLTVIVSGYKLTFSVKVSERDGRHQYSGGDFNFKPEELVDLGVCSLLREGDTNSLSVFIIKNYIHSLKPGSWGFVSNDGSVVCDFTGDSTGVLHEVASQRTLSFIRKCDNDESPTQSLRKEVLMTTTSATLTP
eukprot:g7634.t1 g7634   contig24:1129661-1130344(+)